MKYDVSTYKCRSRVELLAIFCVTVLTYTIMQRIESPRH